MRVPISGGPRELVMEFPSSNSDLDCPIQRGAPCIIMEGRTFIAFDPLTGKRRELFRRDGEYNWTISPDGAHIAEVRGNTIGILSLTGRVEQTIEVTGWPYLATIDWAADGKSVLVSHSGPTRATLLRVRLNGLIEPIWEMQNVLSTWAVASPDGRYLAIKGEALNSNVWLLENF